MYGKRRSAIAILSATSLCASVLSSAVAPPAAAAVAQQLVFTSQPVSTTGGSAFDPQPVVEVQETGAGTPVASGETVTLSIGSGPAGAALTCDALQVDAVDGVATFSGCAIDLVGTYELLATSSSSDPGTSAPFDVVVGPASEVVFTNDPSDITAGAPFVSDPAMGIVDAGGNPVDPAGHDMGLAVLDSTELPINLIGCTGGREIIDLGVAFYSTEPVGNGWSVPDCSVAVAGTGYSLVGVAVPEDVALPAVTGFSGTFDVAIGSPAEWCSARSRAEDSPVHSCHASPSWRSRTATATPCLASPTPSSSGSSRRPRSPAAGARRSTPPMALRPSAVVLSRAPARSRSWPAPPAPASLTSRARSSSSPLTCRPP